MYVVSSKMIGCEVKVGEEREVGGAIRKVI